jgi:hypothetical protein
VDVAGLVGEAKAAVAGLGQRLGMALT